MYTASSTTPNSCFNKTCTECAANHLTVVPGTYACVASFATTSGIPTRCRARFVSAPASFTLLQPHRSPLPSGAPMHEMQLLRFHTTLMLQQGCITTLFTAHHILCDLCPQLECLQAIPESNGCGQGLQQHIRKRTEHSTLRTIAHNRMRALHNT